VTRLAFLLWPDTFEDWYDPLGLSRADYLDGYDREWSVSLAAALVSSGVDVDLVYATRGTALTAVQRPSGATVHFVPESILLRVLRRLTWGHSRWVRTQRLWSVAPLMSTLSPRLLRPLLRLRPDAVVIQDYETLRFDIAAPVLRLAGARVLGLDTGGSARPSSAPWKRLTRNCAHRLLAVHEREAARLRALGHQRVAVWPVPVRTDVFTPADRGAARQRLGIGPDERLVFSATRLHPVKNLPLLVDACRDATANLVLTGDGPERGTLEQKGMPGLRLVGWQTPEQLRDWYAAADVVALSSNQEGQPTAVLEAFACGRAVVATAVGGVPEVVRPGETGWLVPPRDRHALSAALTDALADRSRADALGERGRSLVLSRYSAEAVARTLAAWASE
jgi:glycosyltransferase involved in cell wall biosynthesis